MAAGSSQATTALVAGQSPTWAAVLRVDVDVTAVDAALGAGRSA